MLVTVEHTDEGITTVTLNRPDALNALSSALRSALTDTIEGLAEDDSSEVIVLTGAGRAFTVGLDLKELGGETESGRSAPAVGAVSESTRDLSMLMSRLRQPVIGAVNGYAITGGFELALMCDFLIASTEARFADTHARVGVVPGWGLSQRLPRLIGINRAKELSLTGNYLDAETAYAWGLVNRVVAPDALLPTCYALARDIVSTDIPTRQEIKRVMDEGWARTLDEGLQIEKSANRQHAAKEVRADKVAQRRAEIQQRGRAQSGPSKSGSSN